MPRRREEKARERRSTPAAEEIGADLLEGGREDSPYVVSLGGGSEKPLEKFPAARDPHSPPEVPPDARERRPGIRGARRRRRGGWRRGKRHSSGNLRHEPDCRLRHRSVCQPRWSRASCDTARRLSEALRWLEASLETRRGISGDRTTEVTQTRA